MNAAGKTLSQRMAGVIERAWYADAAWLKVFAPLAFLFSSLSQWKKSQSLDRQWQAPVPVIVVGNISVGGTGKTPLVIAIAQHLREHGFKPGIISRGYRSHAPHYPYFVDEHSSAKLVGDEPLLMWRRAGCPVVIDADRVAAVKHLLARDECDVIVSDDGMQHYALARDIEICVIDGQRRLGNEHLLPQGPLREPVARLDQVDFIVVNDTEPSPASQKNNYFPMQFKAGPLVPVDSRQERRQGIATGRVHAVAGIGHPQRFFNALSAQGFEVTAHSFPDHHDFAATDLQFGDQHPIVMTEKDAVKCQDLAIENAWYQPVSAQLPEVFWQALDAKLATLRPPG